MDLEEMLRRRLAAVESRLEAACRRAGRSRDEVTLVAVTKTISARTAALLPELGIFDLGESRPQVLWQKAAALPSTIRWHQVGHLQRNKVERTLPLVHLIHSVDSLRLVQTLEKEAAKQGRIISVLIEVNAGREPQKHGLLPEEVGQLVEPARELKFVRIQGLMTMAPLDADPEQCRPTFTDLRRLRDQLEKDFHSPHSLEHLSMGMSNDFEVAVEEGATFVRLGTVLFEGIS